MKRLLFVLLIAIFSFIFYVLVINLTSSLEDYPKGPITSLETDSIWWKSTNVYQIYPRSFQDTNDDGIGDLAGIISRLDYLKWLGVETLWISPFFESPQQDHGYDVSDYYKVDPVYGDSLILDSLISEVHKRDMKIVFDLVLNHSSSEHPWFQESRKSKDNPKSDWYVWKDGVGDQPPNNWHSALGVNGWTYDSTRQQWYYSAFLPFQPDLNWRNPEVKKEMFRMVRYWLEKGVDGFRLDIFNFIYEDPSFTDNPTSLRYLPREDLTELLGQKKVYNMNHPDNFKLAKELRNILDEYYPPRFMVGEVFGDQATLRKFLGENADGLNMIFLFEISNLKWTAEFFREKIQKFEAFYPNPYVPTYVFSNHDRVRSIDLLDGDSQKAKCLALIQMTLRGVPYLYYGEEIGMKSANIPLQEAQDPLPGAFTWLPEFLQGFIFNRDNYRTPMQWTEGKNAGFTEEGVATWLPVQDENNKVNIEYQKSIDSSLLAHFRKLLELRNKEVALQRGTLKIQEVTEENLLSYTRKFGEQEFRVVVNFSNDPTDVEIEGEVLYATNELITSGDLTALRGNSGIIVKLN